MLLYTSRQLIVILGVLLVLVIFVLIKNTTYRSSFDPGPAAGSAYVYELSGNIPGKGFYTFSEAQTIETLLRAGGAGGTDGSMHAAGDRSIKVPTGSRVVFSRGAHITMMGAADRLNFFLPVPVNRASVSDLSMIPGIGIKTAENIIAYRKAHNGITALQELTAVKGIGTKKLNAISPYLTVEQ